ncbi:MAG: right-handed parallel beta-helix repeat-containing protein, partial [Bacteroidales bacterium]|nr:right-handed parallel beta-helix repeat-containing protein [Bacteroidales bacterium]
ISNNSANYHGGAIYCEESYIYIENVIVTNNISSGYGGGLYIYEADPIIEGITITGNSATGFGGGIYSYSSGLELVDADITDNTASSGGAIYLSENYFSVLNEINMSGNTADNGGGLYLDQASPELKNMIIKLNEAEANESKGGGIFCSENSNPSLENVTINNNSATNGGGIYNASPDIQFHDINRCNIYFNDAVRGNEVYSDVNIALVVDTFTVFYPHDYFAEPFGNFTFDILNEKIEQVNADLYISQYGSNSNSGLWAGNALKTLRYAFSIVRADSLNPKTFYLLNGTYGSTSNGETMPVNVVDNISIEGESENNVFIDGENLTTVFEFLDNHSSSLANMRIKNGNGHGIHVNSSDLELSNITVFNNSNRGIYAQYSNLEIEDVSVLLNGASGIYCENTSMNLHNITISQNNEYGIYCHTGNSFILENSNITGNANRGLFLHTINFSVLDELLIEENYGGGIRLGFSNPIITNCVISNNHAEDGGGLNCSNNSNPFINKVLITNNSASNRGGGIFFNYASDPVIVNVEITNNTAEIGAGISCFGSCEPMLTNITIANNSSSDIAGAIYSYTSSNPIITNSILWNNLPEEIYGSTLNITFSDILGGWEGEGNENVDPSFIGSGNYPFALSDQSLCINEGNPDTTGLNLPEFDLAGDPRFRGGRIDMGAYENQSVSTSINQNSQTNNFDLTCQPNPFSDELTISWNQTESAFTKIEIYNSTGKRIKVLVSDLLSNGDHDIHWKSGDLKPGVFYIRLKVHNNASIKKIIKL